MATSCTDPANARANGQAGDTRPQRSGPDYAGKHGPKPRKKSP